MQANPTEDDEGETPEPPSLRWLRRLVTVLTLVLIFGMLTIVGLLVMQLGRIEPAPAAPGPVSAERLTLPAGEAITAIGGTNGQVLIVTEDASGQERLHSFDAESGALQATSLITRE